MNSFYLSPSSSSPSSDDARNIVRLWIPFSRIETINGRINVVYLDWLRTEARQSQRSRWNGASGRHIGGGWLLRCRLNGGWSGRWFRRTRMFETLLNGYRPVLTDAIGRIDDAAIVHATSDDPLGLSNSAGDGTLREHTRHKDTTVRIIQINTFRNGRDRYDVCFCFVFLSDRLQGEIEFQNFVRNLSKAYHSTCATGQALSQYIWIRYFQNAEAGIRKEQRQYLEISGGDRDGAKERERNRKKGYERHGSNGQKGWNRNHTNGEHH